MTAIDPEHAGYDEGSEIGDDTWCVVHVEFLRKFQHMVTLEELRKNAQPGGPLENMQALQMPRLSVSKLSEREWFFILDLVRAKDKNARSHGQRGVQSLHP